MTTFFPAGAMAKLYIFIKPFFLIDIPFLTDSFWIVWKKELMHRQGQVIAIAK